jgi:hypothetical protein
MVLPVPEWTVVSEPVEANPSATDGNEGGLIIRLKRGDGEEFEVTRVGYVRRNSKNPGRTFEEQRTIELDKAYLACETLNDLQAEHLRVLEIAFEEAQAKLRDLFGTPDPIMA